MSVDPRAIPVDPRFDTETRDPIEAEKKRGKWTTCLIGCMVVLGVMLIAFALIGFWAAPNWPGWTANFITPALNQGIDASELPPAEKQEIKDQVKRLDTAFRDGSLSMQQIGVLVEKLTKSPLMPALIVMAADKQYLEKSGLSAEEKADGRKTLQRYVRGMIDKKINEQQIDKVLQYVADKKGANGQWQFRQTVSDADLQSALAEAKLQADAAEIPDEPATFDPSDEFKKIIDDALGEAGAGADEVEIEVPPAQAEPAK